MTSPIDRFPAFAILGSPGSGKGTLARQIAGEHGLLHVEMGDILRRRAASFDELGVKLARTQGHGLMVATDIVIELLNDFLEPYDSSQALVLDGFPRTSTQVAAADDARVPILVRSAVWLEVPRSIAEGRLRNRARDAPRSDDADDVARRRLDLLSTTLDAVREDYRARGLLEVVDATQAPDRVYEDVLAAFEPLLSKV